MTAVGVEYEREPVVGKWWWVLLISGLLWILIGLFVLAADFDSAVLIGYLVGFWLIFAAVAEFVEVGVSIGWKWLHVVMAILLLIGGIAVLTAPFQTFTILADLIGIFLVLKGTFDFVIGIVLRRDIDMWWMTMIAGIFQILLGIWALGYPGRSAALLILWIGVGAIIRGIVEIVTAFHVQKSLEAVTV